MKRDLRIRAAFRALTQAAEEIGWPKSFRTDLTQHDYQALQRLGADTPFLWVLRDSGTHFYPAGWRDGSGMRVEDFAHCIARSFGPESCRFFIWDGAYLRRCKSAEEASSLLRSYRCPLCGEGSADVRTHLLDAHEFEIEARKKNSTDPLISDWLEGGAP